MKEIRLPVDIILKAWSAVNLAGPSSGTREATRPKHGLEAVSPSSSHRYFRSSLRSLVPEDGLAILKALEPNKIVFGGRHFGVSLVVFSLYDILITIDVHKSSSHNSSFETTYGGEVFGGFGP